MPQRRGVEGALELHDLESELSHDFDDFRLKKKLKMTCNSILPLIPIPSDYTSLTYNDLTYIYIIGKNIKCIYLVKKGCCYFQIFLPTWDFSKAWMNTNDVACTVKRSIGARTRKMVSHSASKTTLLYTANGLQYVKYAGPKWLYSHTKLKKMLTLKGAVCRI